MKKLGLNEIREEFLRFLRAGHLRSPASLVPKNDRSVLL